MALVGLWVLGELAGAFVGELVTGSVNLLVYGAALAGAVLGSVVAFGRARCRPMRLTTSQLERVRAVCDTFTEVGPHPFERRVADLQREANPERDIANWERLAHAYRIYCEKNSPPVESKQEAYRLLLLRSLMPAPSAIEQAQLQHLTAAEAEEVIGELDPAATTARAD